MKFPIQIQIPRISALSRNLDAVSTHELRSGTRIVTPRSAWNRNWKLVAGSCCQSQQRHMGTRTLLTIWKGLAFFDLSWSIQNIWSLLEGRQFQLRTELGVVYLNWSFGRRILRVLQFILAYDYLCCERPTREKMSTMERRQNLNGDTTFIDDDEGSWWWTRVSWRSSLCCSNWHMGYHCSWSFGTLGIARKSCYFLWGRRNV